MKSCIGFQRVVETYECTSTLVSMKSLPDPNKVLSGLLLTEPGVAPVFRNSKVKRLMSLDWRELIWPGFHVYIHLIQCCLFLFQFNLI